MWPVEKVNIFVGPYGSGKTELAINYAVHLAQTGYKVALVDLDIVNLYFRSRETRNQLEAAGVRLITPMGKFSAADLPAISPEILGALQNEEEIVVFDVGGDDVGATALGRFNPQISAGKYNLFFVVNTCRPFTRDAEGINHLFGEVVQASRLKATALISNSNLADETDQETILQGFGLVQQVSRELDLPVAFVGVSEELVDDISHAIPTEMIISLHRFMLPPWYEEEGRPMVDPATSLNRYKRIQSKEGK